MPARSTAFAALLLASAGAEAALPEITLAEQADAAHYYAWLDQDARKLAEGVRRTAMGAGK